MKVDISKTTKDFRSIQIGTCIIWVSFDLVIGFRHKTNLFVMDIKDGPTPTTKKHINFIPKDNAVYLSMVNLHKEFEERFKSIL